MVEFMQSPEARWVIWFAISTVLVVVGIYLVKRVREAFAESGPTTSDHMTKFREMHSEGDLSNTEFRTIKGTLAKRLHEELKDTDGEG